MPLRPSPIPREPGPQTCRRSPTVLGRTLLMVVHPLGASRRPLDPCSCHCVCTDSPILPTTNCRNRFKELKGDLAIRPIYHQTDARIEAHIFVAFLAYCLQVTLKQRLRSLAPGLTPRSVLEKMAAIQMVDMHLPTTDGRTVLLSRYTEPELDQLILLRQLKIDLPAQPSPRIASLDVAAP